MKANAYALVTTITNGRGIGVTNGMRVGGIARKPRLASAAHTSDCVCYTINDDDTRTVTRIIPRNKPRTNNGTRTPRVNIESINKHDDANAHKVTASMLAPLGNID